MVKNWMLSPKIWNKARMATVTISIQLCTKHPSQVNSTRKRKKSHTNCIEIDKNVLIHKWHNYLKKKNPKKSGRKTLRTYKCIYCAKFKHTQKNQISIYQQLETKTEETILFIIALPKIKFLSINLTSTGCILKEIKEKLNRRRIIVMD